MLVPPHRRRAMWLDYVFHKAQLSLRRSGVEALLRTEIRVVYVVIDELALQAEDGLRELLRQVIQQLFDSEIDLSPRLLPFPPVNRPLFFLRSQEKILCDLLHLA